MNKEIYDIIDLKYNEFYENYFGCSMLILFTNSTEIYDGDTISEQVEVFLYAFKRMVDEGLILAYIPIDGEPVKELQGDMFWDVSSDRMIEYIRSVLPSDPKYLYGSLDDVDDEFIKFWHIDCPPIRWVDKDTGKIY